ncbi:MAG: cytochrome c oxidase assembly protein [Alphaproteobacteria bacterium]|nr:cytochrome c oxidase assembly protein [Alphaproteobacteria bacterium]MBL6939116.1 cytochrome c oxidase assembly protein [Alphaproteobacteria bacterium]MBL7096633.1 cytochrome c oxidase assembly protein [Alphaproteobacteria bacterium]
MPAASIATARFDGPIYLGIFAFGFAIDVACRLYPAQLPFWMPWEFSWTVYLATALSLLWFWRGWQSGVRIARWRAASFLLGALSFYVVLQTHVDYWAQHMFFVHRLAHFVLHHAGAFLIGLAAAGPVLRAGMPGFLTLFTDAKPVRRIVDFLQHPAVAPLLFVGLLYFWLLPSIHTRVMLDTDLYDLMNCTMAINGAMFWSLVLDPRPRPPARLSHLMRAAIILIIELPQMLLGALLSLSTTDWYPVYTICGRLLPMTAMNDQHYGGLIIWLPGTLTSFAAMIAVLWTMRVNEERAEHAQEAV